MEQDTKSKGSLRPHELWMHRYETLVAFVDEHGRLPRRSDEVIGVWVITQRTAKRQQGRGRLSISPEQEMLLEAVPGWTWDMNETVWLGRYQELLDFVKAHERLPQSREEDGPLGNWVATQRRARKGKTRHKMSPERIRLLEQVPGWSWSVRDEVWSSNLIKLREFVGTHRRIPSQSDGKLGMWTYAQRIGIDELSGSRRALIESVFGQVHTPDR